MRALITFTIDGGSATAESPHAQLQARRHTLRLAILETEVTAMAVSNCRLDALEERPA